MRARVGILYGIAMLAACGEKSKPFGSTIANALIPIPLAFEPAPAPAPAPKLGCPAGMTLIEDRYCIDTYEAYVVLVDASGRESPHSPYQVVEAPNVKAKVAPNVVPQGFISQVAAARACKNAGKRLCAADEFELACRGPDPTNLYPYGGTERQPGACNEGKGSSVARFYGMNVAKWTYSDFNDPKLNQWVGGLAKTGQFARCVSPYGVFDLVGNLHEWGDDAPDAKGHGRFRGGFYGDAEVNGHGCAYVTKAHEPTYHDYSTGFRCCADARTIADVPEPPSIQ